jgi:MYXO-CTERM domain-containing protein
VTLRRLRRSFSAVPLATALLLCCFAAKADTLTGSLGLLAPQGTVLPGDHPVATGTGSFSFSSDLTNGLSQFGSVHVLASDLTAFNLTVMTHAANFAGAAEGPTATYTFGLANLTSIDITVRREGSSGFSSPGLENFGTTAVGGNIPDYGLATLTDTSLGVPVNVALNLSVFSYPGFPGGPGFPNGASAIGQLAVGNIALTATTTPEPASFLLAAPALAGLWFIRRRRAA